MKITTTGGWALWTPPQEPDSPLTARGTAHTAIIVHTTPITEVAQPVPTHLPVLTTQPRSGETHHPASLPEWSAAQGDGEVLVGLLLRLAQYKLLWMCMSRHEQ